jgi:type IX secretion system PorP/SprF family membrane protein
MLFFRSLIILLTGIVFTTSLLAQDPQFSQFYAVPLYTNPALTGASGNIRFNAAYRDQYIGVSNNFKTTYASVDAHINKLGGLGVSFLNDVAGDGRLTTNQASLSYSFYTQLSRKVRMRAAVQTTFVQKSYDFSRFRFGDQIDDRLGFVYPTQEPLGSQNRIFPNFGSGLVVYSETFFVGFAAHNLTEPNQSFYYENSPNEEFKLPRRYTAHAGLNIPLTQERNEDQRVLLSPSILYMSQRNFNQLNLGMYVKKQALTAGLWFRQTSKNSDAAIVMLGLKLPKFRLGYSYDVTVSGARTATQGSHELSLAFEITPKKRPRSRVKMIACPAL